MPVTEVKTPDLASCYLVALTRESRATFGWERLLDVDVLRRCRLFRLCFDECFVECDFFATVGSSCIFSMPAPEVDGGTAAGLVRASSGGDGGDRGDFTGAAVVEGAGALGVGCATGFADVLARPGHSEFEKGTFGHDRHTNAPANATTSTPRRRQGTRRFFPSVGTNSESERTFPSHMLSSGFLRRGAVAPGVCCVVLRGEISRI
jgi:hypothetical protein